MTLRRHIQPQLSVAIALVVVALLVVAPRVWIELRWFEQFNLGGVLLRRLGLQLTALLLVLGIGIPVQLQQLQRGSVLSAIYTWVQKMYKDNP